LTGWNMAIGEYAIRSGSALGATAKQIASGAARTVVRRAEGYVVGRVRNALDSVLSQIPGGLLTIANPAEDFNRLRHINHQLVHTDFQGEWNFRLEIEGAPEDFDFYVKDITYSHFDIATDEERYGAASASWPTGDQPLRISFTMRDNIDGRNSVYFSTWWGSVISNNGTVGLPLGPKGYVRAARIYNIDVEGNETPSYGMNVYPIQVGELSRSRENGQFLEIPVTLVQFSTIM